MISTPMIRTKKRESGKKHNKRKEKDEQIFTSRMRLFAEYKEDLLSMDLKCNL